MEGKLDICVQAMKITSLLHWPSFYNKLYWRDIFSLASNNVVTFSFIIKVNADSSQYLNKSTPQNQTIHHLRQQACAKMNKKHQVVNLYLYLYLYLYLHLYHT